MGKYLHASAKAVEKLAGPLAFPLAALTTLMEDEATEERFTALLSKIASVGSTTHEMLDEVLKVVDQSKALKVQVRVGFDLLLTELCRQREVLQQILGETTEEVTRSSVEAKFEGLANELLSKVSETPLLTEQALLNELCRLFPRSPAFLAVVGPAGFPMAQVPGNVPPNQTYAEFIEVLRGLGSNTIAHVSKALSDSCPGSNILSRWASIY